MTRKEIKLAILNGKEQLVYEELVNQLIEKRYSIRQELAIQRQKETKPDEFKEYNDYAESCKAQAKAIINEIKGGL